MGWTLRGPWNEHCARFARCINDSGVKPFVDHGRTIRCWIRRQMGLELCRRNRFPLSFLSDRFLCIFDRVFFSGGLRAYPHSGHRRRGPGRGALGQLLTRHNITGCSEQYFQETELDGVNCKSSPLRRTIRVPPSSSMSPRAIL